MNTFFLIFIGIPVLEIFLMIKIGSKIGALNTTALIFLTAIMYILCANTRNSDLRSGLINLYKNKTPIYELLSGASIAFAAILLIVSVFFTDIIGFILLIPLSRNILFKLFENKR